MGINWEQETSSFIFFSAALAIIFAFVAVVISNMGAGGNIRFLAWAVFIFVGVELLIIHWIQNTRNHEKEEVD